MNAQCTKIVEQWEEMKKNLRRRQPEKLKSRFAHDQCDQEYSWCDQSNYGFDLHRGLDIRKPEKETIALMHEHFFGGERRVKALNK